MDMILGIVIFSLLIGFFIWSCNPDNAVWGQRQQLKQQRQQFEIQQRQQQQQQLEWERLHDLFRPRYSPETIRTVHPNATIVITGAVRLGQVWHVILVHWPMNPITNESEMTTFVHGQPWFVACNGEAVYPEGFLDLAPTFHDLEMAITCPSCREKMARVYHWNNQPYYSRDLYPIQCQLLISPDFIDWDIMKLHPSEPFKFKAST